MKASYLRTLNHFLEVIMRKLRLEFILALVVLVWAFPLYGQHSSGGTQPTYVGSPATNCRPCHNGTTGKMGKVDIWLTTLHATAYDSIPASERSFLQNSVSCLPCHTTGWDTTVTIGGFSDFFRDNAHTHADTLGMQNTKNVQCEDCHKPYSTGIAYDTSYAAAKCGQCHGGDPHTPIYEDWKKSMHAISKYTSSGKQTMTATNTQCAGCHTSEGMVQWFNQTTITPSIVVADTSISNSIACAGCHDPHGSPNAHQLRLPIAQLCEKCHNPEYPQDSVGTAVGKAVHNSTAYMFEGKGGYEYPGSFYPSSAHTTALPNKCVTCHVATVTPASVTANTPVYTGHSFVPRKEACETCHADIDTSSTNFDYRRTQTTCDSLAAVLATKLATAKNKADSSSLGFMHAKFNYDFYTGDGSHGIHNADYAKGLLISAITNFSLTGVRMTDPSVPGVFDLKQNYPNPFNPSTFIDYDLPKASHVTLKVFSVTGQEVATLVNENHEAGHFTVQFNAGTLASGIYFYRLQAGEFVSTKKLLLLK